MQMVVAPAVVEVEARRMAEAMEAARRMALVVVTAVEGVAAAVAAAAAAVASDDQQNGVALRGGLGRMV